MYNILLLLLHWLMRWWLMLYCSVNDALGRRAMETRTVKSLQDHWSTILYVSGINRNQLSFAVSTYWTIQWVLSEASAVLFASVSCDDCVNMTCYNHTTNMQAHSVCCTTRTLLVIAICLTLPEQLFDCYIFFYLIQAQTHTGKQNSEIC